MRMRSSNPVFNQANSYAGISDRPITYSNVAFKTLLMIAITAVTGVLVVTNLDFISIGWLIGAMIIGFISVIIGSRSIRLAPFFSIVYAVSEGFVLGIISVLYASIYEGIIPTAITTTFIVFVIMLLLFTTNIIKVNQKFASFLVVSLISVIIMSILSFILPFGGNLYIIVVFISAALSAFFLLWDFQRIKDFVEAGADEKVGWILALGLMVTIVWIYIEMLRLLAITSRR